MAERPKSDKRIPLPEAVKRMDKALKRETGTPPKPYQPAREKSKRKPSNNVADLLAPARNRSNSRSNVMN